MRRGTPKSPGALALVAGCAARAVEVSPPNGRNYLPPDVWERVTCRNILTLIGEKTT